MNRSTESEVRTHLEKALQRLNLEENTNGDYRKVLGHLEVAKDKIENELDG